MAVRIRDGNPKMRNQQFSVLVFTRPSRHAGPEHRITVDPTTLRPLSCTCQAGRQGLLCWAVIDVTASELAPLALLRWQQACGETDIRAAAAVVRPDAQVGHRGARAPVASLVRLRRHRARTRRPSRVGGGSRMSTTLDAPSRQWATRPDDERFLTLDDLAASVGASREHSRASDVRLDSLALSHAADGDLLLTSPDGQPVIFTNWSFGQLASLIGAPASYLRKLPAPLARVNLEWGLEGSDAGREQAKLLYQPRTESVTAGQVRAFTSTTYGRIWDVDVVRAIQKINQDDRWQVPLKAYDGVNSKRATTLYASDRDVFIFLVDEAPHRLRRPDLFSRLLRVELRGREVHVRTGVVPVQLRLRESDHLGRPRRRGAAHPPHPPGARALHRAGPAGAGRDVGGQLAADRRGDPEGEVDARRQERRRGRSLAGQKGLRARRVESCR